MNIQKIQEKVDEIVKAKNIQIQEVYNSVIDFLETTYNSVATINGDDIILNNIKIKILSILFSKSGHKHNITERTKFNLLFDLSKTEMKYFEKTIQDLITDGLISKFAFCISLTDKGIIAVKNIQSLNN